MVVSELNTTKEKFATANQMLSDKLVGIQIELNDTRNDLIYARRETADMKQTLIDTQMELNSTKTELGNIERTLTWKQEHFTTGISERQNCAEKDLNNIKRQSANISSRVNALEIVSHQIAKLKHYFKFFSNKVARDVNVSVYRAALIRMSESGDKICPVYLKMQEFTKFKENREIWHSETFYLHKRCKVCLYIDASKCRKKQGPLLQLHLIEGPYNNERCFPLWGELRLLLVNHDTDGADLKLIHKRFFAIKDHQAIISKATLPIGTQNDQYFKDDTIIVCVSFSRHYPQSIFFIGIFLLLIMICIVFGIK